MGANEEKERRGDRNHAGAIEETGGRSGTSVVMHIKHGPGTNGVMMGTMKRSKKEEAVT